MAQDSKKNKTDTMAWIAVLAIAITLCAVLSLAFADYVALINKNLSTTNSRLAIMEENEIQLLNEIQSLHNGADTKTTH